jgi:hypothetical protein
MGLPVAIAAAGVQLVGAGMQMYDNSVAETQRAENANYNRHLALDAAADSIARGFQDSARTRMAATQTIARQSVAFGASGVDGSVGTAAEAQGATRMMSELDAKTQENNAFREAWGFQTKAQQIRRQSQLDHQAYIGKQWGTALGGIGSAAASFATFL